MNDCTIGGPSATDDAFLIGMACGLLVEDAAPARRFTFRDLAIGLGIVVAAVGLFALCLALL